MLNDSSPIIFFKHIKKDKLEKIGMGNHNQKNKEKPYSKVKILDKMTKNEINICNYIRKITNYNRRFHVILKYSLVNFTEVDISLGLVKTTNKEPYLFLSYSFINNPIHLSFNQYFSLNFDKNDKKYIHKMILNIITSFRFLIESLEILWNNGIIHSNLNNLNICFNQFDCPYICNFSRSFHYNNGLIERKREILDKNDDKSIINTFIPIHIHIACYLHNHTNSLSKMNILDICNNYFNNILIPIIRPFYNESLSNDFIEVLREKTIFSLQKYVNEPKDEVINDIIRNNFKTWDIHSLFINYILLIKTIENYKLYDFFEEFIELLVKNLFLKADEFDYKEFLLKFDRLIENCDFDDL
jgi:hypothetical protein